MPAGEEIQLAAELVLQGGDVVFLRMSRMGAELDRRFDGEGPGGQRQGQLRPDALRCAWQKRKFPAQLAAEAAAERKPRLGTTQKAASVFQPALPFRQTAAVILHGQADVLFGPLQMHPDIAAGRGGTQGI